jgi:activator of HSP90 ATPase
MKTIAQSHFVNASPEEVYLALTNPLTIELWSGYPAEMQPVEGTEFALFEGDISGMNIELVPNQKVVQEWYFGDNTEKSIVTILLKSADGGTHIDLEHTNIPDPEFENMIEGWKSYYWGAIKKYFR